LLVLTCAAVVAGALAVSASADPGDVTVTLFNCAGPAGTPTTIVVEKENETDVSLRAVDGTSVFRIVAEEDLTTGTSFVVGKGLYNNGVPLVTCDVIRPNGDNAIITGLLTPSPGTTN
jgi:hypothetical protein